MKQIESERRCITGMFFSDSLRIREMKQPMNVDRFLKLRGPVTHMNWDLNS